MGGEGRQEWEGEVGRKRRERRAGGGKGRGEGMEHGGEERQVYGIFEYAVWQTYLLVTTSPH